MRGERESFMFPIGQTEQRTNPYPTKSAGIRPLRTIQAPVEILLRPGGVEGLIGFAMIGFLIDDQTLRAMIDQLPILIVLHRTDLQRQCRKQGNQRIQAFLQVALGHKFRMFPATSNKFRNPCACRYFPSVTTCSTVRVVRKIAASREKPQYEQLFTHSFETYSGANNLMVFPKF